MTRTLSSALTALILVAPAPAGKYNAVLSPGDAAPDLVGLPGTDGKPHSLSDFRDAPVVVILFTCNSCPTAIDYEDRTIALARKYAGKAAVIAVNPNTIPADRPDKMAKRAKEKGFPFPYVHDAGQTVAKAFGAQYTPEYVVLDRERKVVYLGALDDKTKAADAKVNYVEAAIDAALAGRVPEVRETLPRGCKVRFNRARRDD